MAAKKDTGVTSRTTKKPGVTASKPVAASKKATASKKARAAPAKAPTKAVAAKAVSPRQPSASAPKARRGASLGVERLEDLPALLIARSAPGEGAATRPGDVLHGLGLVAQAFGSIGRPDLAAPLLALMPDDFRAVHELGVEAAAGHDVTPFIKPWLEVFRETDALDVARILVQTAEAAREPVRAQLVALAREQLDALGLDDGEPRGIDLMLRAGDLEAAQRLVDRAWRHRQGEPFSDDAVTALARALLDRGDHEAAFALMQRLTPDAVGRALSDSAFVAKPTDPALRARIERVLDGLPEEDAKAARASLAWFDDLSALAAGGNVEPGPYDMAYVDDLFELGHLDAVTRFLAERPPSKGQPGSWALARFRVGLDDFATLLATLGESDSRMSNVQDWLSAMRLLLGRDPHDPQLDQLWGLVTAELKKGPRTPYDKGVVCRITLEALGLRADVALARGEDVAPYLEPVRDPGLLREATSEELRRVLARWHKAGKPEPVAAIVAGLPPSRRAPLASFAAEGYLPDVGRAVAALFALTKARTELPFGALVSLVKASAREPGAEG